MALKFDTDALVGGFRALFQDVLEEFRDDAHAEVLEHAESLAVRAAKWAALAAGGDAAAEIELKLLRGIALSIVAQVAFKQQQAAVEALMAAARIGLRFLVGAMAAA